MNAAIWRDISMKSLLPKFALALLAMMACSTVLARPAPPAPPPPKTPNNFCNPVGGNPNNPLPGNMCFRLNVPYGSDPLQKLDVYMPASGAHNAPVIFMVHGGGWYQGDKMDVSVVWNKVQNWVPTGVVFVSIDYPLVPQVNPLQQARSVAKALGYAQRNAAQWGGDPNKFIVMGFSAGGHLTSLLATDPSIVNSTPASLRPRPWLGTIALDSAVYDVAASMNNPSHDPIFDQAFGTNPAFWNSVSPTAQMRSRIAPFLAICSTVESGSCTRAQAFVDKALGYGTEALVVQQDLMHGQINDKLGLPSDYTTQVNLFMTSLLQGTLR
jgi:acetyl esterase/lipase